jgi:hypothetical protein
MVTYELNVRAEEIARPWAYAPLLLFWTNVYLNLGETPACEGKQFLELC